MEEDRAQVDIGVAVEAELAAARHEQPRLPKKRFVGRKEAAARVEKLANEDRSVENSGAIQGLLNSK